VLAALLLSALAGCSARADGPDGRPSTPRPATSTAASPSGSTTLALIGDFGNCGPGAARVADMIGTWDVAAVATAGDNTYEVPGCTPFTDSVGDYYDEYVHDPAGPRFFPALGNHDYDNVGAGLAAYRDYFTYLSTEADPQQRWYDAEVGGIHLFVLDSQAAPANIDAQRAWLQRRLAASRVDAPAAWNVVVLHEPPFTSGKHEPDTAFRPAAGWDYAGWGADVVVAGHQHIYEDVVVDGFHYVTAGIGTNGLSRGGCPSRLVAGSQVCTEDEGALRMVATPTSLTFEYRTPGTTGTGVVEDTVTLSPQSR